jgi:hypothetical protein
MNRYPTTLLLTALLACLALCLVSLVLIAQMAITQDWYRFAAAGFAYTVFLLGALVCVAKLAGWNDA